MALSVFWQIATSGFVFAVSLYLTALSGAFGVYMRAVTVAWFAALGLTGVLSQWTIGADSAPMIMLLGGAMLGGVLAKRFRVPLLRNAYRSLEQAAILALCAVFSWALVVVRLLGDEETLGPPAQWTAFYSLFVVFAITLSVAVFSSRQISRMRDTIALLATYLFMCTTYNSYLFALLVGQGWATRAHVASMGYGFPFAIVLSAVYLDAWYQPGRNLLIRIAAVGVCLSGTTWLLTMTMWALRLLPPGITSRWLVTLIFGTCVFFGATILLWRAIQHVTQAADA